jgi:UDP:flavonoid glycosyltransferase YjiC (YdhE family)
VASILFATAHAGGNVPPTRAIAAELARRGHTVRVIGHAALATTFEGSGVEFVAYRRARPWSPIVGKPGIRSMLGWLRLASDPGIAVDVAAELARAAPDVVVVDCMIPAALRAARRAGSPVVMLVHAFSGYWLGQWSPVSPMGLWQRLTRTAPRRFPADLALVTTDPQLDVVDRAGLPATAVVQTGPIVPAVPGDAVAAERPPRVLVSFSTISYPGQAAALQRVLDAIAALPVTAIVTVATSLAESDLRVPVNVERRGFVPHEELLPGASLLVGHGGHGTTMTALAHGVPVLVVAMSSLADQPLVGAAVAREGAGATLPRTATIEQIRAAMSALLETRGGAAAERALALSESWRDGSATSRAADAVLALVEKSP